MGYQMPQYVADMLALLAQLHRQAPHRHAGLGRHQHGRADRHGAVRHAPVARARTRDAAPLPVPVRRLVLNDVGPAIQWQALQRIGTYLGKTGRFDSVQQAADAMWAISTSFGPHTPAQWLALSQAMVRPLPEGGCTLHYDPAIAVPFRTVTEESAAQGRGRAVAAVRPDPGPDAAHARRRSRTCWRATTALAMTRRGPQGPPGRIRRCRTCADLDRGQPGRGRGLVPAGTMRR